MRFTKDELDVIHATIAAHVQQRFGHRGNSGMLSPSVLKERDQLDAIAGKAAAMASAPENSVSPAESIGDSPSTDGQE